MGEAKKNQSPLTDLSRALSILSPTTSDSIISRQPVVVVVSQLRQ